MIISKELLSEVLGIKEEICSIQLLFDDTIVEWDTGSEDTTIKCDDINIYELAHKCKEWARKKGISIYCIQYKVGKGEYYLSLYDIANGDHVRGIEIDSITYDTEFEAVIKACEWVRVQNDK